MNEVMETILHRRAIRRFRTKQVEESALQQILKAGLYAPSAGGRHPAPKPRKENRVLRF